MVWSVANYFLSVTEGKACSAWNCHCIFWIFLTNKTLLCASNQKWKIGEIELPTTFKRSYYWYRLRPGGLWHFVFEAPIFQHDHACTVLFVSTSVVAENKQTLVFIIWLLMPVAFKHWTQLEHVCLIIAGKNCFLFVFNRLLWWVLLESVTVWSTDRDIWKI